MRKIGWGWCVLGVTAMAAPPSAFAQVERGSERAAAAWLTHPDLLGAPAPADTWLRLRSSVTLDTVPDSFPLVVALDTKYWLYVNGEHVVREGGLKQGPSPTEVYADRVDLAPHLRPGDNAIALEQWHFGRDGFSHRNLARAAFLARAPAALAPWHLSVDPAHFTDTVGARPNYRLPEANIAIDGRRVDSSWLVAPLTALDTAVWPQAAPLDTALGRLVERPIPQWKDFGLRAYADAPALPYVSDGDTLVVDLPYNAQVTPAFEVSAPEAGMRIDVRTDNYRGGGPPNVRTAYLTRAGRQRFETPGWMNGHRVRYHFPAGLTVHDVSFRESGYATERTGAWTSGDAFLDRLWEKSARTLYITMRDSYMDCPDRERAQWWGDVVIELGEAFYAFDSASTALARKGLRELFAWQRPDSTIYSPVPAGNWDQELPTQMLASVGEYGLWTYFYYSGDTALLEQTYPALQRYVKLWELDGDGLVIPREGGWTWGDWGEKQDYYLLFQGWYGLALRGYRNVSEVLGEPAEVAWAEERIGGLRTAVRDRFWTEGEVPGYRSPDFEHAPDDRVQALAVLNDWTTPGQYGALRQNLTTVYEASPYMERYVAEALMRMGMGEVALERLRRRYTKMVDSDLTTLWEGWGLGAEGFGGGTYNHAWSGGPLTILSQRVAGVEPAEVAWGRYRVTPQLSGLDSVRAVVPVRGGTMAVSWVRDRAGVLRGSVRGPAATEGELVLATGVYGPAPLVEVDGVAVPGERTPVGQRYALAAGTREIEIVSTEP